MNRSPFGSSAVFIVEEMGLNGSTFVPEYGSVLGVGGTFFQGQVSDLSLRDDDLLAVPPLEDGPQHTPSHIVSARLA